MMPLMSQAVELSNNQLAGGVVAVLVTMIGQHFAFKKYIRDAAGIKETTNNEVGPQPFVTKKAEEYVTRDSFHKHAELNRQHHDRIEREAKDQINRLENSHHNLAREVSALTSTVDVNGDRLITIDKKVDEIKTDIASQPAQFVALLKNTKGLIP